MDEIKEWGSSASGNIPCNKNRQGSKDVDI
jgi:hypothetical protein